MRHASPTDMASPKRPPRTLLLLFLVTLSFCCQDLRSDAQKTLPPEEVDTLRRIAEKLKMPKEVWNFSLNPCSTDGWVKYRTPQIFSSFTCGDCNNNTDVCHVVNIALEGQNLAGVLPEEFGSLPSLTVIHLSRNYISGSIPATAWSSLPLQRISLIGNRISGVIPDDIGKITTLQSL